MRCTSSPPQSLARLFTESGFTVRSVETCFRGEYLGIEASPAEGDPQIPGVTFSEEIDELTHQVATFAAEYRERVARWGDWLQELRRTGRTAVPWGSGARAVSFLTALKPGPEIPRLVDINPKRQGLFMPRTAQPVAAPESLAAQPPDEILITNPAFESEIRDQAASLGVRSRIRVLD